MNHSKYLKDKYGSDKFVDILESITNEEKDRLLTMLDRVEKQKEQDSLISIAIVKSYAYMMEYDPNSGREVEKQGAFYLKQGYIDGFLAGVAHRLTGGHDE